MPPRQPTETANRDDAAALAQDLNDQALHCRDMRHSFPKKPNRLTALASGYERVWICTSCGVQRTELLTRFGRLVSSKYTEYPEGYLAKGIGRIGADAKGAFRLESIERMKSIMTHDNSWGVDDEGENVIDLRSKRKPAKPAKSTPRGKVAARG